MSIFRSYFLKNNTLIGNNLSNNSQNPVTEVSYGTANKQVSRYIFDVDLNKLRARMADGFINQNRIVKHYLRMTNTISYAQQYVGKKSYSQAIDRATSFDLNVFNISEDWDEGGGYDFIYGETLLPNMSAQASNWKENKTGSDWTVAGAYSSGDTLIGTQRFEKGCENIEIDVTDYINSRLTGTTGTSFGLGIKFPDNLEVVSTKNRQAVAFHAKNTNTFYEPFIETVIEDEICDDRNYFYMDKFNYLFLYVNVGNGNVPYTISVNSVEIRDNDDNIITTLTGASIINVSKGIYKIGYMVDSSEYPERDSTLFRDIWSLTVNGRDTVHESEFYIISADKYFNFDQSNQINFDNYHFYFYGISEKEILRANTIRKIKLTIKELYPNQNNFLPLEIEYRLFTTMGKKYEIDVIPFTTVNRTKTGYEFNLDTSWLIPQDYYLQIRMKNGNYYENKQTVSFTIVSNNILKV